LLGESFATGSSLKLKQSQSQKQQQMEKIRRQKRRRSRRSKDKMLSNKNIMAKRKASGKRRSLLIKKLPFLISNGSKLQ
jgi:hypothetical protein